MILPAQLLLLDAHEPLQLTLETTGRRQGRQRRDRTAPGTSLRSVAVIYRQLDIEQGEPLRALMT